jgi:hypothetical protein
MIDIFEIAGIIGALTIIGGPMIAVWRSVTKLLKRVELNCADIQTSKNDMKESKEERKMLLEGVLACLYGLEEQGCNGPVKKAIDKIEQFIIDRSHD